jgi:hypothetical protein
MTIGRQLGRTLVLALLVGATAACGPRVIIATGTTIGLKATPGDPQGGRSPQVTFGYKRAEAALVATRGDGATEKKDAYSTLASFGFSTAWFGDTELASFIATGFAARGLTAPDVDAPEAAKATVSPSEVPAVRGPSAERAAPPGGGAGENSFLNKLNETAAKKQ